MPLIKHLVFFMFSALLVLPMTAQAGRDSVLVEPGMIEVPAGKTYTQAEVRKAILVGASRHHWRVVKETPGLIQIKLDGRKDRAVLTMEITHDTKSYTIRYVSSEELRYREEGATKTIHSSYHRWMKNLVDSINDELRIMKY